MITKKKKNLIIVTVGFTVLLLLFVGIISYLYFMTDTFKSNKEMFNRYSYSFINEIFDIKDIFRNDEIEDKLDVNKYKENTEVKVNYTYNIGTTAENKTNDINNIRLISEGKVDRSQGVKNRNIKVNKNNNTIFEVDTLNRKEQYGIRFPGLYKQYLIKKDANAKSIIKSIGFNEDETDIIPVKVNKELKFVSKSDFKDDELNKYIFDYLNILNNKVNKNEFDVIKGTYVNINQKNYQVEDYFIKIGVERFNNIYIDYLEKIKNDSIVLSKYTNEVEKKEFIKKISQKQENIRKNNIGDKQSEVHLYVKNKKVIKFVIVNGDYKIIIDLLDNENLYKMEIENKNETIYELMIQGNDGTYKISTMENKEGVVTEKQYTESIKKEADKYIKDIYYSISKNSEKVEAYIVNKMMISDFDSAISGKDVVFLDEINNDLMKQILDKFKEKMSSKVEGVKQNINMEDVLLVFKKLGIVKNRVVINGQGITEIEKTRFNAKYEILVGDGLKNDVVLRSIGIIKNDISKMEMVKDNLIKFTIDSSAPDFNIYNQIEPIIKDKSTEKYRISLDYNEDGLVSTIYIEMSKDI